MAERGHERDTQREERDPLHQINCFHRTHRIVAVRTGRSLRTNEVDADHDAGITDAELTALALAADPDAPLGDDAVALSEVIAPDGPRLLPDWYMPAPMGGAAPLRGWRRRVIAVVIAAFLVITAYGLCNTYGQLHGG